MIFVEDVHKRYLTDHGPGEWILQGVNFTIPPKVNVGLVGKNGAGKSTLLRLIGGTDVPTRGKIERRCRVSWPMGFGGGLQGSLTGRQNATFVCRIHGHEDDILDRIAYIEDFAELGVYFDEPVKTYSSGMKSRLNFALSMAFDFDVYISDEVTAVGDAAFKNKAQAAFQALADHASLIMVSHGEGTLKQFCSAGIWLNEGQAHWFDDINDALKAYKETWETKTVVATEAQKSKNVPEPSPAELEEARQRQADLEVLKSGLNGAAATVGDEEGKRVIRAARQAGMNLVGVKQIADLGYRLKPEATPVLRKYSPTRKKHINLYELHSQCVKMESD